MSQLVDAPVSSRLDARDRSAWRIAADDGSRRVAEVALPPRDV